MDRVDLMRSEPQTRPFAVRTFPDVGAGLAAELALLDAVSENDRPASAFLWQAAERALVLPRRFERNSGFRDAADGCARAGWPVTTRATGGGITPQGPGILNLALVWRPQGKRVISDGYGAICAPLVSAFTALGLEARTGAVVDSFCDGDFNLEVDGRKVVGTAQRWRRGAVLAHALILVDPDLPAAVGAAQQLADGLGLQDRYRVEVHATLAALTQARPVDVHFVDALAEALEQSNFDPVTS